MNDGLVGLILGKKAPFLEKKALESADWNQTRPLLCIGQSNE